MDILIVIDMQQDFIDGSLGSADAKAIIPSVVEKIKEFDSTHIYATMDTHGENYANTREGRHLPVIHCIKGTEGHRLHPDIVPLIPPENIIEKKHFTSMKLMEIFQKRYPDRDIRFHITGLVSDICVLSNALLLKAFYPENDIFVYEKLIAGSTKERHLSTLEVLRSCQIEVVE